MIKLIILNPIRSYTYIHVLTVPSPLAVSSRRRTTVRRTRRAARIASSTATGTPTGRLHPSTIWPMRVSLWVTWRQGVPVYHLAYEGESVGDVKAGCSRLPSGL